MLDFSSDIIDASGRRMIEAMIAGETDPNRLAALAGRGLKVSPQRIHDSLHGRLRQHHRFLLQIHLGQGEALDKTIRAIDPEVDGRIAQTRRPATKRRPSRVDPPAVFNPRRQPSIGDDDPPGDRFGHEPLRNP